MAIQQISKICIKKGSINYIPDSLDEAEMCFTTDTGEIFIGAPNFGPVQYRSESNSNISPYRNIKILTEFDAVKSITGDIYFNGPLVNVVFPITSTAASLYTFDENINSIIVSYSLYDGANVNLVGELYINVYDGIVKVCCSGQTSDDIIFSGTLNSSNQVVLQGINTSNSQYTLYMNATCWENSLVTWDGTKGQGLSPICLSDKRFPLEQLSNANISSITNNDVLYYDSSDSKWENISLSDLIEKTNAAQTPLGFTPVQQGTGVNQLSNTIKIGYDGSNVLVTVDTNNQGAIAFQSWVNDNFATENWVTTNFATENWVSDNFLTQENANNIYITKAAANADFATIQSLSQTNTNLSNEIARAEAAEQTKQDNLGFIPVQQGTGVGQNSDTVKIGSDGTGNLKATVNTTDYGNIAFQSWVTSNFISNSTSNSDVNAVQYKEYPAPDTYSSSWYVFKTGPLLMMYFSTNMYFSRAGGGYRIINFPFTLPNGVISCSGNANHASGTDINYPLNARIYNAMGTNISSATFDLDNNEDYGWKTNPIASGWMIYAVVDTDFVLP